MKRVLIVDDDADVRDALAELFEESYQVLVAANGQEALEVLAEEHADAILLDLMMPIMDGETFLKELHVQNRTVPVVLLSASRDLERRAKVLGATGYCAKPCSADQVLAEIARVIDAPPGGGEQSGGGAPTAPASPPPPPGTKASPKSKLYRASLRVRRPSVPSTSHQSRVAMLYSGARTQLVRTGHHPPNGTATVRERTRAPRVSKGTCSKQRFFAS